LEGKVRSTDIRLSSGDLTWGELKGLSRLEASDSEIKDLDGIECLTGLTYLDVSANGISNLKPLAGLKALETLKLGGNLLTSIADLAALTNLKELNVHQSGFMGEYLSSISVVRLLTKLTKLYASQCGIDSIDGLQGHQSLEIVDLRGNSLSTLEGLGALPNLAELDVSDNMLTSAAGLTSALTNLSTLKMARQRQLGTPCLTSIEALSGVSSLTNLDLGTNPALISLAPLDTHTRLVNLSANSCGLTSTEGLRNLGALTTLDLGNNALESIAELEYCTSLDQTLNLSRNPNLVDISPLARNTGIGATDTVNVLMTGLKGAVCTQQATLDTFATLKSRSVAMNTDCADYYP
jgi:Leucine-rich repeat (LRR) protein